VFLFSFPALYFEKKIFLRFYLFEQESEWAHEIESAQAGGEAKGEGERILKLTPR